jgi:hypothetical protein
MAIMSHNISTQNMLGMGLEWLGMAWNGLGMGWEWAGNGLGMG